jgi:hypothetical protein
VQRDRSRCIERGDVEFHERSRLCAALILARSRSTSRGNPLSADWELGRLLREASRNPGKPGKSTKLIWGYRPASWVPNCRLN